VVDSAFLALFFQSSNLIGNMNKIKFLVLVCIFSTLQLFGQSESIKIKPLSNKKDYLVYIIGESEFFIEKDSVKKYLTSYKNDRLKRINDSLLKTLDQDSYTRIEHNLEDTASLLTGQYVTSKIRLGEFSLIYKGENLIEIIMNEEIQWTDFGNGMTGGGPTLYELKTLKHELIFSFY